MFKKSLACGVIFLLLLSLVSGFGFGGVKVAAEAEDEKAPPEEQVFRFRSNSAVIGLNPLINTTAPDNGAQEFFLETLIRLSTDEESNFLIVPGVAESWECSEDGKTYTFHLRKNAMWNDGVPVTAHDFVYTFRKMANPETASTNAWLFDGIIVNFKQALYNDGENAEYDKKPEDIAVTAPDEHTLVFELEKPYSYFVHLLHGAKPVREDAYEKWGDEYGSSPDKVVTNGPWVIESWEQNVQMTLLKNENYWNAENVSLTRIERRTIGENQTAVQALLSGEIDTVGTNDPNWKQMIEATGDFQVVSTLSVAPEFFSFNCKNKYFRNEKIRVAFMLAYDRDKLVAEVNQGNGGPLFSMMPDNIYVGDKPYHELLEDRNYLVKSLQEKYPDPKALLIEGLKEEGLDEDPAKVDVALMSRGTAEFSKKYAEWMIQQWKSNLGVEVKIDMMEWNIMWDKIDQGEYDIATSGWGPYYNDPSGLLSIFDPVNGYFDSKKSGWEGEDADRYAQLLVDASNEPDQQKRAELYLQAEELLVGTGVISPSYLAAGNVYVANYVRNIETTPFGGMDYCRVYLVKP